MFVGPICCRPLVLCYHWGVDTLSGKLRPRVVSVTEYRTLDCAGNLGCENVDRIVWFKLVLNVVLNPDELTFGDVSVEHRLLDVF